MDCQVLYRIYQNKTLKNFTFYFGGIDLASHPSSLASLCGETTRTDPWSIGRVIPVKPWCTGKQLPLGFNPMDLGSVRGLYFAPLQRSLYCKG